MMREAMTRGITIMMSRRMNACPKGSSITAVLTPLISGITGPRRAPSTRPMRIFVWSCTQRS
jgi:hypothetical protein